MINKKIEEKLKKLELYEFIEFIEKCEAGEIEEIHLSKKIKFSEDKLLNKEVLLYFKKLKIKIIYVKEKQVKKNKCTDLIHSTLFKKTHSKKERINLLTQSQYPVIKIDNKSFGICPKCFEIIKI
jgi:hypothetical protein